MKRLSFQIWNLEVTTYDHLTTINIIIKLISENFTETDTELFEENPEEYIRRDIEGNDVDTRRRAACDLVKILSKYFEGRIMEIFGAYIQVNIIKRILAYFIR